MQPSQLLFDLLQSFEGLKLSAYQDVAGIWTIGYGTTVYPGGTRVQQGDTCTAAQAQQYVVGALTGFVNHLNATIPAGLTQAQFDSLCDFIYNAGIGAWDSSSLRVRVNQNPTDYANITLDFEKWDKAHVNGQLVEVNGLLRRRKCEAYLYANGVNHPTFYLS